MTRSFVKQELIPAQIALFVAIALQILVWIIHNSLVFWQILIIPAEIVLALLMLANIHGAHEKKIYHYSSLIFMAIISFANISSLGLVLYSLIVSHASVTGLELLVSAVAIFVTNIIVLALWYWQIDSPRLMRVKIPKHGKVFQFTQQNIKEEFANWQPGFVDYMYLSVTNAINFAAADAMPLTDGAKLLMGTQALISVFTLALLVARAVSILGA